MPYLKGYCSAANKIIVFAEMLYNWKQFLLFLTEDFCMEHDVENIN